MSYYFKIKNAALFIFAASFFLIGSANAQVTGGQRAFTFLQVSNSPHITAMGSIAPASYDDDVSLMAQNPALLNENFHKDLYLSYNRYFADIGIINLGYAHHYDKWNTDFGASIQYFNYGKFIQADEFGNALGDIRASDLSLNLHASRYYKNNWRYGATAKLAYSNLGDKNALAFLTDVGVAYIKPEKLITIGIVAKNIGFTAKKYNPNNPAEPLPFDLQIGVMKGLKNMPLRVFLNLHHLYEWDIRYNDPAMKKNNSFVTEEPDKDKKYVMDKIFRHINFGGELTLAKRVTATVAYSHLRRSELGFSKQKSMAGFSFGLGVDLNKLKIQLGRSYFGNAGPYTEFGLIMDMNRLLAGKKTTTE